MSESTKKSEPAKWSRRSMFHLTGSVAGAAVLSRLGTESASAHSLQAGKAAPATAPAQQATDTAMGQSEARYAYTGSYTRGAPGGWSELASSNHPVGISVFSVGAGMGDLKHIQTVPSDNPSFVAIHPSGNFLYACNEVADYEGNPDGSLETYAIDDATGQITLLNRVRCGSIPAHLSVDATGTYLALATYVGGTYELYGINEDGSLSDTLNVIQLEGSGPHARQDAPHAHMVAFSPNGNFIAGVDLGTDTIKIMQIADGTLAQVSEGTVATGSGPRHAAFHPNGQVLYVLSELVATVTAFAFDSETGALGNILQTVSTVPQNFPADKSCAEIMVHPSGQFLYSSNRKFEDHPLADAIVAYRIDATTGHLRLIGFTTEDIAFPRGFNLDPTGTWLYALGQKGDSIVQLLIDPASGALIPTGQVTRTPVPVSIVFKV